MWGEGSRGMQVRTKETSLMCPQPFPRSPISSLPTLFDQTVSCSSSGQLENVPQATPNIEQLLEKQGNGEAGVNSESLGGTGCGRRGPCACLCGSQLGSCPQAKELGGGQSPSLCHGGSSWQGDCNLGPVSSPSVV